jgi:type III secretion protein R
MLPNLPDPFLIGVVLITLGLAPLAAMVVTSYTKIVVVLGLLRNALGVQGVPPNTVMNGIALILSAYIMAPIGMQAFDTITTQATNSSGNRVKDALMIAETLRDPMRAFFEKHASERERKFFHKSASALWPPERAKQLTEHDFLVLIPAFTVSELTEAFQIGFVLYLSFIVIDLVIANILLAMGMSMISPTTVAIPFKLLLFVVLDGWSQLIQGLVMSYR